MRRYRQFLKKLCIFVFIFIFAVSLFPFSRVKAAYSFDSGAVVINADTVNAYGNEFIIRNGVFSVTVTGDIDVSIIFEDVTIDRSGDTTSTAAPSNLYAAGSTLGWRYNGTSYYVPTCPFLITGGAQVTARFDGDCTFRAGGNGWYMSSEDGKLQRAQDSYYWYYGYYGGYAGIQVDSNSSLTVKGASNLSAFGAYQIAGVKTNDPSTSNEAYKNADGTWDYIKINSMWSGSYSDYPNGTYAGVSAGGAGIGGGTSYNATTISVGNNGYTTGTPGEIIIDGGNIKAVGGHLAAGIGGGVNSAATSSQIVINDGNIEAVGGRYACGIGDGDSTNDYTSKCYAEEYAIIINGGTVNAYGGTSAAAIGTTDNITSSAGLSTTSGLSITIAGGKINAQSGEATGSASATAAIGVGENTDMPESSITINSAAEISAVSFSNYAISNYGTDSTAIPVVNIDPDGYMYLARFEQTSGDRVLDLYPVKTDMFDNPMYVSASAYEVLDGTLSEREYYAFDSGKGKYYLVDENGMAELDENGNLQYPDTIPALSYYYNKDVLIGEYTVPGKYKAVALTLPDPTLYGGVYVIHIPYGKDGTADDIFAVMEKLLPGTTSGKISENYNDHHVPTGDNTNKNENKNIEIDAVAAPLISLSVFPFYSDTGVYGGDLIGKFNETTYGYTVYLPCGTEKFKLNFGYDVANTESILVTGTALDNKYECYDKYYNNLTGNVELTNLSMNGRDSVDIWIRKTDANTGAGTSPYVVYKVTVILKSSYTLNFNDVSKTYDGRSVSVSLSGMTDEKLADVTDIMTDAEKNSIIYSYYHDVNGNGSVDDSDILLSSAPKDAGNYILSASLVAEKYEAYGLCAFTVDKKEISIVAVKNWLKYISPGELYNGEIADPGEIVFSGVISGETVTLADGYSVAYKDLLLGFSEDKITLKNVSLADTSVNSNYVLSSDTFSVPGQISYEMESAIFKKTASVSALWRKFYPTSDATYLKWDSEGNPDDTRIDYHSPSNVQHREYVYLRTVNEGELVASYAVDIEFGAMQFSYSRSVWNVNTYQYEQGAGSIWSGNDGVNNLISVKNYSNRSIKFSVSAEIEFIYRPISDKSLSGIIANVLDGKDSGYFVNEKTVPAATARSDISAGSASVENAYLVLSGTPQMSEGSFITVGYVTVTISAS